MQTVKNDMKVVGAIFSNNGKGKTCTEKGKTCTEGKNDTKKVSRNKNPEPSCSKMGAQGSNISKTFTNTALAKNRDIRVGWVNRILVTPVPKIVLLKVRGTFLALARKVPLLQAPNPWFPKGRRGTSSLG